MLAEIEDIAACVREQVRIEGLGCRVVGSRV